MAEADAEVSIRNVTTNEGELRWVRNMFGSEMEEQFNPPFPRDLQILMSRDRQGSLDSSASLAVFIISVILLQ